MTQGQRTCTILVVDDSRTHLAQLSDMLRQDGYTAVHTVRDPRTAVAECREHKPDVILLDYVMPHLDGLQVMDALQAARLEVEPAVILVTGHSDRNLRLEALRRGARDFICRPFDPHELLARLANVAQAQFLQRQLRHQNVILESMVKESTQRLSEVMEVLRHAERQLAEQLEHSREESRRKSEFLANATHELRTPLNAILGFSDLLVAEAYGPLGDPHYAEYAHDIHTAAEHLLALVEGTMDLAKAESGQDEIELRDIDIGRTVQDSIRLLRQLAEIGGVSLCVSVPETPLRLRSDPEKIRQIVLNLASNAIKFTPKGGSVTVDVSADRDGGACILVIRDTGIGIAPQDLATALRPFGQVRSPDRPHPKGTGLGLPLTRRFVEMLGGSMAIDSRPGHGTVVTVRLPALAEAPSEQLAAG